MEFMYLSCSESTRMPGESYRRRLRSLLLCNVFRVQINSLVCWFFSIHRGGGGGGGEQTNVRNKFEVGDKTKYTPSGESIHRKPKWCGKKKKNKRNITSRVFDCTNVTGGV